MIKYLVIFMVILLAACSDDLEDPEGTLFYGTSFGECLGYCVTETRLDGRSGSVRAKGWNDNVETREAAFILSQEEYNQMMAGIDLNKFAKLPETLGCPDCADGGAEWLELTVNGERKRVTFEYMENVDGIKEAIVMLRNITNQHYPEE